MKVSIGQIISHDPCTMERIIWNKSELGTGSQNYFGLEKGLLPKPARNRTKLKMSHKKNWETTITFIW